MSYSRWSTSTWYTFWSAFGESTEYKLPTKRLKNNQCMEICDFPSYFIYYGKFKEIGMDGLILDIKKTFSEPVSYKNLDAKAKNPTEEEIEELKGYILRFIDDVDDHFKWKNFFMYEWYYPSRNKIIFWYRDKFKK